LRKHGFIVHPLYEVYGEDAEQGVKDPDWIKDSARNGWPCICRDKLRHSDERAAVEEHAARIFRVTKSAINADQQIELILKHITKIERLARKPGPYIYRIERSNVVRVYP
jgi:PIN like domain